MTVGKTVSVQTFQRQWFFGGKQSFLDFISEDTKKLQVERHSFFKYIILFIFGSSRLSLLCRFFSSYSKQGLLSNCGVQASCCGAKTRGLAGFNNCSVIAASGLQNLGSVIAASRLQSMGSIIVARGFSCSVACGVFPDQGLNLYLLHWQVDSSPVSHQGSPNIYNLYNK